MAPRKKKTSSKYMEDADRAFSKFIRTRDGRCMRCGSTSYLQCAHIHSRSYKSIRTHPDNAVALCRGCHTYMTHRPLEWREWVEAFAPMRWDRLAEIALQYGRVDWKAEAAYWKHQLEVYA